MGYFVIADGTSPTYALFEQVAAEKAAVVIRRVE
jgi:hypothetical protein